MLKWIKQLLFLIYILFMIILWSILKEPIGIVYLVKCFLSVPVCAILVLIIHEFTHYFIFKIFKIYVKKLKISIYLIDFTFEKPQISISENKFFGGYCTVVMPVKERIRYVIIGLASGGISGIVLGMLIFGGYIFGFIKWQYSPFLSCLMIVGIYSFYTTLIRKNSADRVAMEKLMSLMKENI